VTTIAENIGFIFHGEYLPVQQLIDFLKERSMLLVLDNFEHLLDGAQLVADLIQFAPNVCLMTTSRERLNLRGETVYSLRCLDFPTLQTPDDALRFDAVKLFLQSAHRIRSDFELDLHDLDYMTRICRLTAGLPLGIELAAGWVDILSLEQIAAEIQRGIDILETEIRDVPERIQAASCADERFSTSSGRWNHNSHG
jgi:predicted ATPase